MRMLGEQGTSIRRREEMEEREEGGDAREGEAESSRPQSSVKACLYSVRKKCKHVTFD